MVTPRSSKRRFRSKGLASSEATAVKPNSFPRQAPSVLSVTSAQLMPQALIWSIWAPRVEKGLMSAKQPIFMMCLVLIRVQPSGFAM